MQRVQALNLRQDMESIRAEASRITLLFVAELTVDVVIRLTGVANSYEYKYLVIHRVPKKTKPLDV